MRAYTFLFSGSLEVEPFLRGPSFLSSGLSSLALSQAPPVPVQLTTISPCSFLGDVPSSILELGPLGVPLGQLGLCLEGSRGVGAGLVSEEIPSPL